MGGSVDPGSEPGLDGFAVFGNDDATAAGREYSWDERLWVEFKGRRKHKDCATEGVKGWIEAIGLCALCNDAEVIFHSQNFGSPGSVDGLIVSEYELVHLSASSIGASPGDPEDNVVSSAPTLEQRAQEVTGPAKNKSIRVFLVEHLDGAG
jgi:hypothetical protein